MIMMIQMGKEEMDMLVHRIRIIQQNQCILNQIQHDKYIHVPMKRIVAGKALARIEVILIIEVLEEARLESIKVRKRIEHQQVTQVYC